MLTELEKFDTTMDARRCINEFLDFLSEQSYWICKDFSQANWYDRFKPIPLANPQLLSKFFGIDEAKLEVERRALLECVRRERGERTKTSCHPSWRSS